MRNLYIARHGQDIDNSQGILNGRRNQPLTELGLAQARNLAENIAHAHLSFTRIYSSPLIRAYKTADIIADHLSMEKPAVLENLIERDFGVLSGKLQNDIPKLADEILPAGGINYFLSGEGVETFPELYNRAKLVLKELENTNDALIVCHGDIGKMIYAAFYEKDWKEVLVKFHFGNSDLLYLSRDDAPGDPHKFKFEQFNT